MSEKPILTADIHSHILWGVDGGAKTISQSLELLRSCADLGIQQVILTPHYSIRKGYVADKSEILSKISLLTERCHDENTSVKLYCGNEIEFSYDALEKLRKHQLLTLADTDTVLVEFPSYTSAREISDGLKDICLLGYQVVLAHVERYPALCRDFDRIEKLKQRGIQLQIDLKALTGSFEIRRFCAKLLRLGLCDFVATDVHDVFPSKAELQKQLRCLIRKSSEQDAKTIITDNPTQLLLHLSTIE